MEAEPRKTPLTQEEMMAEILENTRKTRNYIKWQMIITVAFVVIPLIASLIIIPFVFKSLSSVYGGGLLQ